MDVGKGTAVLLVTALVLNVGWLWAPLGIAALLVASVAAYRAARQRWQPVAILLALAVVWLPYLYVIQASGLTVGFGDRVLLSLGGDARVDELRALTGAIVPLVACAIVGLGRTGLARKLAIGGLACWLVLAPAALWIGAELGPDDLEEPAPGDPPPEDEVGPVAEALIVLPLVVAYLLSLAAPAWVWWEEHRNGGLTG